MCYVSDPIKTEQKCTAAVGMVVSQHMLVVQLIVEVKHCLFWPAMRALIILWPPVKNKVPTYLLCLIR